MTSDWAAYRERCHARRRRLFQDARDAKAFSQLFQDRAAKDAEERRGFARSSIDASFPSVVDDTFSFFAGRGFDNNLRAFLSRLPLQSRRTLGRELALEATRTGLAALFFARDEFRAGARAAAVESIDDLDAIGQMLSPNGQLWPALYGAIELFDALGDDSALASAFCLRRSAQLLDLAPYHRGQKAAASGTRAPVGALARPRATHFADSNEIAGHLIARLRHSLTRRGRRGWAALAPLINQVDCYFGTIPKRKRVNAIEKLQLKDQLLLGLIDLTTLGSGKCSFCFTPSGVVLRNGWLAISPGIHHIKFAQLADAHLLRTGDIGLPLAQTSVAMAGTTLDPRFFIAVLDDLAQVTTLDTGKLGGL